MSENATFVKSSVTISPDFLKKCTGQFLLSPTFSPQVSMYAPEYHKMIPQNIKHTAGIMC